MILMTNSLRPPAAWVNDCIHRSAAAMSNYLVLLLFYLLVNVLRMSKSVHYSIFSKRLLQKSMRPLPCNSPCCFRTMARHSRTTQVRELAKPLTFGRLFGSTMRRIACTYLAVPVFLASTTSMFFWQLNYFCCELRQYRHCQPSLGFLFHVVWVEVLTEPIFDFPRLARNATAGSKGQDPGMSLRYFLPSQCSGHRHEGTHFKAIRQVFSSTSYSSTDQPTLQSASRAAPPLRRSAAELCPRQLRA